MTRTSVSLAFSFFMLRQPTLTTPMMKVKARGALKLNWKLCCLIHILQAYSNKYRRTDLVFDVYQPSHLKAEARSKWGRGVRHKGKIPSNWRNFLRHSDTKQSWSTFWLTKFTGSFTKCDHVTKEEDAISKQDITEYFATKEINQHGRSSTVWVLLMRGCICCLKQRPHEVIPPNWVALHHHVKHVIYKAGCTWSQSTSCQPETKSWHWGRTKTGDVWQIFWSTLPLIAELPGAGQVGMQDGML